MEEVRRQIAAVRESSGWWERADLGLLAVSGPDRYTWLQGMVTNDVRLLERGEAGRLQACILDPTGHLLADLTLLTGFSNEALASVPLKPGAILIETPAGLAPEIAAHLDRFLIMEEVEITEVSSQLGCLTIQGPASHDVLSLPGALANEAVAFDAEHTGSGGVDLYAAIGDIARIRAGIALVAGPEIGPAAREILRIEAGIPMYGADMSRTTLAPEAGLQATHISLTKGCYVGQEIVARIDSRGHTNRALSGLLVLGETLPAIGERLFAAEGAEEAKDVGWVTSVAPFSPAVGGRPIALGYVRHESRVQGGWLRLGSASSTRQVEVVSLPFFSGQES